MKISIKTLKGTFFDVNVEPKMTVSEVKSEIEKSQGCDVYPCGQQMLIHQGKVLKDGSTLEDNGVKENSFLVIMLTKAKGPSGEASTASKPIQASAKDPPSPLPSVVPSAAAVAPTAAAEPPASTNAPPASSAELVSISNPAAVSSETDVYGMAASNLVAGGNFEETIQRILDIGGGSWDRETVARALRAAYNNPERAIEYLYSGIPEQEAPQPAQVPPSDLGGANPPIPQAPASAGAMSGATSGPNANPLDLFPQGLPTVGSNAGSGTLDFLRNSPQFQALRSMVQANPQILQPMLQELGKQNPHLVRLIQEHQADFLRLINEPVEGAEGNLLQQLASSMPQAVTVTPEEREAIERLVQLGFDRATVLEVFFACNKNEELAANYLLDHMNDLQE